MSKVKIVFFVDVLLEHFDGVSNTMHQIIARIPKDKVDAIFITPMLPKNDIGFPVYECPFFEMWINKGYRLALPRKMTALPGILAEFKPDLIHWSSPSYLGKYAMNYALQHQLPATTIYHTHFDAHVSYYVGFIPFYRKIFSPLVNFLMGIYRQPGLKIFAPTQSMVTYLQGIGIKKDVIRLWGRGIDCILYNPSHRNKMYLNVEKKKILFVSRLVKEKETNTLIRIYQLIEKLKLDYQMVLTGDGPDKKRLEKKMPGAIFTGKLTGSKLAEAYASCDVFIFPSVTETFGNVILEALASGLPVVVADAGGPADIVRSSNGGIVVKPRDESAFVLAIQQILEDPTLHKKYATNGLKYTQTQQWDQLVDELISDMCQHALSFKKEIV